MTVFQFFSKLKPAINPQRKNSVPSLCSSVLFFYTENHKDKKITAGAY
jgi:hypothetical protein